LRLETRQPAAGSGKEAVQPMISTVVLTWAGRRTRLPNSTVALRPAHATSDGALSPMITSPTFGRLTIRERSR
jgi:hypothetical protein